MPMPRLPNGFSFTLMKNVMVKKSISKLAARGSLRPHTSLHRMNTILVKIKPVFK